MYAKDQARSAGARKGGARARRPQAASRTPLSGLLALQSAVGNAAVVQMLRRAGHPGAEELHQHGADCDHQQTEQPVQRSSVQDVLRTGGRPLDNSTRTEMEARLGADFSDVRIHTGSTARASAAEIGARAYTSRDHVVLGDGGGDKHTLAHELTHVIQQRQGPVAGTDNGTGLRLSDPADDFEREAEATATRVMSGPVPDAVHAPESAVSAATASTAPVQRSLYMDGDEDKKKLTRQEVLSAAWYQDLHPDHQQRVEPYIDLDHHVSVGEVIEYTRNTVVGAVDGGRREDTEFLMDAWHRKQNLNAYDLAMQAGRLRESLEEWGIPPNTMQLTQGSITGFGHHVPHTDVLVPHPGNIWSMAGAPDGLANCLESIMGANSTAWVFTDNEQAGYSQAEAIRTAINAINQENSGNADYIPLAVQVTPVTGMTSGDTYDLAGAPLTIGHQPPYRVVTVTRR
ncbi:DUF4157 domain-containing protein [Streptomyces sp. NPDC050619]|uniref:eCIS core domain-containing protein n=1 Tax=Streptomyces sp. NPDC050619 TaxID=3157214 RepID=UPI00343B0C03